MEHDLLVNRDIFVTPGSEEEWTLSAAHSNVRRDHYLVFEEIAADLRA